MMLDELFIEVKERMAKVGYDHSSPYFYNDGDWTFTCEMHCPTGTVYAVTFFSNGNFQYEARRDFGITIGTIRPNELVVIQECVQKILQYKYQRECNMVFDDNPCVIEEEQ